MKTTTLVIRVEKMKVTLNNELYTNNYKYDLGGYILTLLFYKNREGNHSYQLLVNGVDETENFKKQVKEEYSNIPNTRLRDDYFRYANITA